MNDTVNHITSFPDFVSMQRTSFCWFISKGILQELNNYLRLSDFSENIQYIIYPEEYKLLISSLNLRETRKFCGNYKTQLSIPIEIRDKTNNTIYFNNKFPLLILPLMSKAATFYLNGCDRIIVSQIIRSPGIYFEKIKKQKKQNSFKKRLSTDVEKLRSFLPSGEAFVSEFELFFAIPIRKFTPSSLKYDILPNWSNRSLISYSLKYLKKNRLNTSRDFGLLDHY